MPRTKTNFTTAAKPKNRKSFGIACKQSDEEWKEGKHRAVIRSIEEKVRSYEVTAMIFSLDSKSSLGFAKAFLPLCYEEGDIMEQFLETFDNPAFFDEVIGKEAVVDIAFYENDNGVYPNMVSFAKITE